MNRVKAVILSSFLGKIEDVSIPFFYWAGLAVTAFIMLLLPLIYFALIVGIGCLLAVHIQENIDLFNQLKSARAAMFAYAGPIIIGALLVLFMVKPIFARRRFQDNRCPLDPQKESFLYAYVQKIAEVLGAPMPSNIYTIMEVNAYAALKPGIKSFFTNELELAIGLPLAAGTNLHQLTEVIGHELGHFSQTAGMRFSYIIRRINGWFARVVYEKDEWDLRIKKWSKEWDLRLSVILYLARFFIWLTRRLLWALMWVGEVVSCFMMRQMEYDADRHSLALIGAEVFQSSSERLGILSWAHNWANDDLGSVWQEGRLVDDFPALIRSRANQIPQADKQKFIQSYIQDNDRKLFDTHPSTAERIAHARKHDKPPKFVIETDDPDMKRYLAIAQKDDADGLYQSSPPSSVLFSSFSNICKQGTHTYYEAALGEPVSEERLMPFERLIQDREKAAKAQEALEQIFAGQFNLYREPEQFALPLSASESADASKQKITALKTELDRIKEDYAADVGTYSKIDDRLRLLHQASALNEAGFSFHPADYKLVRADRKAISETRSSATSEGERLFKRMKGFESKAFERITHTLSLLAVPTDNGAIPEAAEMKRDAESRMKSWNTLAAAHAEVNNLEAQYHRLLVLAHQLADDDNDEKLINQIRNLTTSSHRMLSDLKERFSKTAYPFDHADKDVSIGQFVVGDIPPADHLGQLLDSMENGVDTYFTLLRRLAANLAAIVVQVEKAWNID